jgi:hypothetical protein
MRPMGLGNTYRFVQSHLIEFTTPHGLVLVEVSNHRWILMHECDFVPLKYRVGRHSGTVRAQINF